MGEPQLLQCFKTVFLEIQNVKTWLVFPSQSHICTYHCDFEEEVKLTLNSQYALKSAFHIFIN